VSACISVAAAVDIAGAASPTDCTAGSCALGYHSFDAETHTCLACQTQAYCDVDVNPRECLPSSGLLKCAVPNVRVLLGEGGVITNKPIDITFLTDLWNRLTGPDDVAEDPYAEFDSEIPAERIFDADAINAADRMFDADAANDAAVEVDAAHEEVINQYWEDSSDPSEADPTSIVGVANSHPKNTIVKDNEVKVPANTEQEAESANHDLTKIQSVMWFEAANTGSMDDLATDGFNRIAVTQPVTDNDPVRTAASANQHKIADAKHDHDHDHDHAHHEDRETSSHDSSHSAKGSKGIKVASLAIAQEGKLAKVKGDKGHTARWKEAERSKQPHGVVTHGALENDRFEGEMSSRARVSAAVASSKNFALSVGGMAGLFIGYVAFMYVRGERRRNNGSQVAGGRRSNTIHEREPLVEVGAIKSVSSIRLQRQLSTSLLSPRRGRGTTAAEDAVSPTGHMLHV
jgi:hypothetical protein